MSDFTVEKGVPLPPEDYRGGGRPCSRPWHTLAPSDSVLMPTENSARAGVNWASRNGCVFTMKKQMDGSGWRVWRKA